MTNRRKPLKKIDLEELLGGTKAPKTIEIYTTYWKRYVEFAGSDEAICTSTTLLDWRQRLIKDGLSVQTINLALSAVKSVMRALSQHKLVDKAVYWEIREVEPLPANVLRERRRPNTRVKIEPEQMRQIIQTPPVSLSDPLAARDRALLLVLATSGMRVSEACAIKIKDIQRSGEHYFVANIIGKGQAEARIAPLSQEAHLAIKDWLLLRPVDSDYLFTDLSHSTDGTLLYSDKPITRWAAYCAVKRAGERAGMTTIKPHDFRRFVGTQIAKHDIRAAQKVLGHKKLETTAQYYVMDEIPLGITNDIF